MLRDGTFGAMTGRRHTLSSLESERSEVGGGLPEPWIQIVINYGIFMVRSGALPRLVSSTSDATGLRE
jgi:hypothetical protein